MVKMWQINDGVSKIVMNIH